MDALVRPVMAARRDASWWRNPGTAMRYHVCGVDGYSRCGVLLDGHREAAWMVKDQMRCKKPGCAQAWPNAGIERPMKPQKEDGNV